MQVEIFKLLMNQNSNRKPVYKKYKPLENDSTDE
jgi:hypothetical protein